jgi:two-component system response regulator HydG
LPALRDHREDIPALLEHFLAECRAKYPHSEVRSFSPQALSQLRAYRWPGNVRELAHMTEKLVLLGRAGEISAADLPHSVKAVSAEEPFEFRGAVQPMMEIERLYAAWALGQTGGHRGQTAEKLGVDPKTLRKWLEEPDREG